MVPISFVFVLQGQEDKGEKEKKGENEDEDENAEDEEAEEELSDDDYNQVLQWLKLWCHNFVTYYLIDTFKIS